jgi:phosphohistidine phosphatase
MQELKKQHQQMKKLIFIRHGKAEEISSEITDFDRSLTLRGKHICRLMARKMKEVESSPGLLISSPAFRAIETARIFASEYGIKPEKTIMHSKLYHNMNVEYLTELLSHMNDENDSVALFGHNPSFTTIADSLCSEGCDFLPKCGIIAIKFNISKWSELKSGTGKTEYYLKPDQVL